MGTNMQSEIITFEFLLDDQSFRRYALNSNLHDVRKWDAWRNHHPEDKMLLDSAVKTIRLLHSAPDLSSLYSKEDEIEKLLARINGGRIGKPIKNRMLSFSNFVKIAAALVVVIGIGIPLKLMLFNNDQPSIKIAYTKIFVSRGQRKMIILNDGTKVWINSESKFTYPAEFKGKERKVYLEGEAYFDVAHDNNKPFSVITSEIRVNVVGTAFNVKSYPDDNEIETTLERGIINIQRLNDFTIEGKKEIFLKPNQKYIFLKSRTSVKVEQPEKGSEVLKRHSLERIQSIKPGIEQVSETDIFTGWRDNKLSFKNDRLDNIKKKMERWYNIKIGIRDPRLSSKRLSGTFVNESLMDALKALGLASNIKFTMINDSVIFYSEKLN